MIGYEVLRLLMRRVPNYHVVSPKFVKDSLTICPCAACQHVGRGNPDLGSRQFACRLVLGDLATMGCEGNAIVSAYGTCDAAKFSQENYDNFKLEGEAVGAKGGAE